MGADLLGLSRAAARPLIALLGGSWRVDYRRPSTGRLGGPRGRNVLYCFWHGRQLPLIYTHRGEGVCVMVSIHRDGQYVANILQENGFGLVRGSSSRGGLQALREMVRRLRSGHDGAITPDGPRGPAERMGGGTAQIARMARVPVVPMGTSGWPRVRFSSWDRFQLALPFARMAVVEGRPVVPARGERVKSLTARIEAETRRVSRAADLLALPLPRLQAAACSLLGRVLMPAAALVLAARPRRERAERRGKVAPRAGRPVWMHGSSMGELRGLLPLAALLRRRGVAVHLTCFTPAGRRLLADSGFSGSFLPLDCPPWVRRFLRRVRPRALVLSETELWPNLLREAFLEGVPGILVNGRLSRKSLARLRSMGSLLGCILSGFSTVMARTQKAAERFRSLGVEGEHLEVWGDSKVLARPGAPDPEWRHLLPADARVLVAGSTRPGEELPVASACRELGLLPVLAPRHLGRLDDVQRDLEGRGFRVARWSSLPAECDAVLVDCHGILNRLYGMGEMAFVGGTLADLGGHNVLEPMAHGVPFVVGPSYGSFAAEVELASGRGAAAVAAGPDALAAAISSLMTRMPSREAVRGVLAEAEGEIEEGFMAALRRASVTV